MPKPTSTDFAVMGALGMCFRGLLRATAALLDSWMSDADSSCVHAMGQFTAILHRDLVADRNAIAVVE